MAKAVIHVQKYSGSIGGLGQHIDRTKEVENANSNLTSENLEIIKPTGTLAQDIKARIKEGYNGKRKIRADQVKYVGVLVSGSHDQMKKIEEKGYLTQWAKDSYDFVCEKFGKENVIRGALHLDEKTPHIHFGVVPITKDGRLSAKDFLNGKKALYDIQTNYAEKVSKYGLERGENHAKRKHITTAQYYKYINQNDLTAEKILAHPNAMELISKMAEIADNQTEFKGNHKFLDDERRILQQAERRQEQERDRGKSRGFSL